MRKHRVIVLCLGLCALLMLAGCGGNGGGLATNGMGGDDTVDMTALDAAQMAAMTAYDAAKMALTDVEDDKSADMDSYDKAKAQVDAAKEANDMAQVATTVADAEKYRDMARDANSRAIMYANMVTTAAENIAAAAEAATRAEKIAPVIARPNPSPAQGTSQFDGLIDRNSPNAPTDPTDFDTRPLTVDGSKVSHSDNKKFAMSTDTPAELMGFAGSIHTREDRAAATSTRPRVMDEVTVYTNQEDSTPTPFSGDDGVHTLNAVGTGTTQDPFTALSIDNDITTTVEEGKNGATISALVNITQHRPTAGTTTITFGRDETANHDNKRLSGTFDMAPGTYECQATCTITMNTDGELTTASTGTITFKPASGAMIPAPDTDYLTFGYWVRTSTSMTGDATTMIAPFARGKQLYNAGAVTAYLATITDANTTVSATYTGSATGQFVHKTDVDGDGKGPVPTSSGQFTADAELTANFTNGTDPNLGTAFQNAINGKISNFKNSTGHNIEGWELILNPAKFDSNVVANGGFTFSAGTSGGKDQPAGGWRGSFFGSATGPDGDDVGTDPDPIQPGSVAGEFLGHFENGHAVGAFGATKQDE